MTKDVFIKEVRDAEAMLYHISKSILKNEDVYKRQAGSML